MRDPFVTSGPTIINASGGKTSTYMVRRHLDAHGGRLPPDTHVVYANTGREREETLRFVADMAERWGVNVRWIERDSASADGWREVDFEHASRNGEPFAELIEERSYLPNPVARFCTVDLKIKPAAAFMRAQGYDEWTSVVGLRRDEAPRVAKLRARDHGQWTVACPLFDARITKGDVEAFWQTQDFRLALEPWEGNCDACFLKSTSRRARIVEDHPELAAWWIAMEAKVGARFRKDGPTYQQLLDRSRAQVRLPLLPSADVDLAACGCTDRSTRKPRPCYCGAHKPARGHTLFCRLAREDAAHQLAAGAA